MLNWLYLHALAHSTIRRELVAHLDLALIAALIVFSQGTALDGIIADTVALFGGGVDGLVVLSYDVSHGVWHDVFTASETVGT
jgi:hypothetical protein